MAKRSPLRRVYIEERLIFGVVFGGGAALLTWFSTQDMTAARNAGLAVGAVAALLGANIFQLVVGAAVATDPDGRGHDVIEDWDEIFPD